MFRLQFHYDIFLRYQQAMVTHSSWKDWTPDPVRTVYFGLLNLLEFALWVGVPLAAGAFLGTVRSVQNIRLGKRITTEMLMAPLLACALLGLAFFSMTKGETARLWLFLVPCLCLVVAHHLLQSKQDHRRWLIRLVILLQFGTVYFTKVNQDFW